MIKRFLSTITLVLLAVIQCFAGDFRIEGSGFFQPETKINIDNPSYKLSDYTCDLFRYTLTAHYPAEKEKVLFTITDNLRLNVSQTNAGANPTLRNYFLEAYAQVFLQSCDLRIGKQLITWGSTNHNNVIDVVNPVDFTDPARRKLDKKNGITALKSTFYSERFTTEIVLIPFAGRDLFPAAGSQWSTSQWNNLGAVPLQDFKLSNFELALRRKQTFSFGNLALTYFNGLEDVPSLKSAGLLPDYSSYSFRKMQMIGLDYESGKGINSEFAYFFTEDMQMSDPCLKNPYFQFIIEVIPLYSLDLLGGIQYFCEIPAGAGSNADGLAPVSGTLPKGYQPLSGLGLDYRFLTKNAFGLILEKKFGPENSHSFEFIGFYSIEKDNNGYMVSPGFKFNIKSGLKLYAGVDILGGSSGSLLGSFSQNSDIFLKIKYNFSSPSAL